MVSDVPVKPADKRILVVSQDGSGDFRSIQSALDASKPGDTIKVKDGIYEGEVRFKQSGTRDLPIALVNYPGHSPVIDPSGGRPYSDDDDTPKVQIGAEWIILEGFEIRRVSGDGIKVFRPHNTIRGNWIHSNEFSGVLVVSTTDLLIEGNTINNNGTEPGACTLSEWGGRSPRHCHGIYVSNILCRGVSEITIRGNRIHNHGGNAAGFRGEGCTTKLTNNLIENNILENNSWGLTFNTNADGNVVRNNTVIIEDYPETNNTTNNMFVMWESRDNIIKNNIFYSSRDDVYGIQILDETSTNNSVDYNLWHIKGRWLVWRNYWISDFGSKYQDVTGWDKNGWCCDVDPDFIDISAKNYRLRSGSPAVDTGASDQCSNIDFEGQERVQGQGCNIGAYEVIVVK